MSFPLRRISQLLIAPLLCAIVALFVPAQAQGTEMAPRACCGAMQAASDDCPLHEQQHQPAHDEESACCQSCALALAMLPSQRPDFVYSQTGETTLVSLAVQIHSLPHRPPVPPPRFASS